MMTLPPPSMNASVQQHLDTAAVVGSVGRVAEEVAEERMQGQGPPPQRSRTPCGLGVEPKTVDAMWMWPCVGPSRIWQGGGCSDRRASRATPI